MEDRQCKKSYGTDLLMRYQKGDTVRLAGSVMLSEFGLMLCDDAGELLEIDGVIQEVMNDRARVNDGILSKNMKHYVVWK